MDFGELGLLPYPRKYDTSCDTWNWRISNLSREKHGGALVLDWSTSQMPSNSTSRFITSG